MEQNQHARNSINMDLPFKYTTADIDNRFDS